MRSILNSEQDQMEPSDKYAFQQGNQLPAAYVDPL